MSFLTTLAANCIPAGIRRPLRKLVNAPFRFVYKRRLAARSFTLPRTGPVLNYGSAIPRKSGAVVQGGRVKLTHLDRVYPEATRDFNVLYLVSSAIPPHAIDLVRFAKKRGVKFVWNQNGVAYPAWAGQFTDDVNGPMRELLVEADYVVYQSAFCRVSADRLLGPPSCPATVLFNPVDPVFFHPAESPPPLQKIRLLAMGTHTYAERVLVTLRCLAELRRMGREAHLTIVGALQWRRADKEIRQAIDELNLHTDVTIGPAFSQDEAAELCRTHHVLLHPKHMDPCPTVVIEALASGLPVVGMANGGMPELVDPASGRLIPAPDDWEKMHSMDATKMAQAVVEIADNWTAFSAAARQRPAEKFDVARWVHQHQMIFHHLLGMPWPAERKNDECLRNAKARMTNGTLQ